MDDSQNKTLDSEKSQQAGEIESADVEESGEPMRVKATRFLRLCWFRRRLVGGICVAGTLISLAIALLSPKIYTSTTTLMPSDNASPYSSLLGVLTGSSPAADLGSEALGLGDQGDLFVGILGSRTVEDSLIARFDLKRYYSVPLMGEARKSLEADTHIAEDRKSGIISIGVAARNPVLAYDLAQGYVDELNRVLTDDSTSSARRERIFLEERLKEVTQDLDNSSQALSQFSTKSGAIDLPSQAKSMVDAEIKLQGELIEGRSELAALRQNYSEDNTRVRAVEASNAELQRQIDKMGGAPREDNSTPAATNSIYPSVDQLPALGLKYYGLERKVQVDQALWESLTKEYEVARVQEAKEIPTVKVLDPANLPERKSGPSRRLILMMGAMLSLAAACLVVLALTAWEEIDPQEEPKKMIVEVIGGMASFRRRS